MKYVIEVWWDQEWKTSIHSRTSDSGFTTAVETFQKVSRMNPANKYRLVVYREPEVILGPFRRLQN